MPDVEFLFQNYLKESREKLCNAMNVHEQATHNGQPCIKERVNAIAWLCHALLLTQENVQ